MYAWDRLILCSIAAFIQSHHGAMNVRPSQLMINDTTSLTELIGVWIRVSVSIYSVTEPAVSLFLEFSMHAKTKFCIYKNVYIYKFVYRRYVTTVHSRETGNR